MPAPSFTNFQTTPECQDNGGTKQDETELDRGLLEIHANCCRSYSQFMQVGSRNLHYVGDPLSACSHSGTGEKIFESDSYKLCSRASSLFAGSHTGGGTVSGASFAGTASGNLSGSKTGAYTIDLDGTLTSADPDGSFSGNIHGALEGTFTGTIVDGVVTVVWTITDPIGITLTPTGNSFTIGGGGTSFEFAGSFSGAVDQQSVTAFDRLTWTHCEPKGMKYETFNMDDGDALVAWYRNNHYSVRGGRKTLLNRMDVNCKGDHPCTPIIGWATTKAKHPETLCFTAGLQVPTCLGGPTHANVTFTAGSAPNNLADHLAGLVLSGTGDTATLSQFFAGTSGTITVTLTGLLSVNPGGGGLANVTANITINSTGVTGATLEGRPCHYGNALLGNFAAPVSYDSTISITSGGSDTISLSGVGLPAAFATQNPANGTPIGINLTGLVAKSWPALPDYCSAFLTDIQDEHAVLISWQSMSNDPLFGSGLLDFSLLVFSASPLVPHGTWDGDGNLLT